MEHNVISPLDRLMILAIGATASWVAVGGMAMGASRLVHHFF